MAIHYTILKYWTKLSLRLFYHRHQVVGKENIPKNGGVIFAGNHQNAPMDAFNIICNNPREPYFATRADIFKKEWIKKILLSLKLYPVYRLRDGRENMKQNEAAFDFFSNQLLEGKSVGIFPEGQASYKYQLLPFKKGMARLALKSLEKNPKAEIYIIPTGLQYENKHDYQGDVLIQFGKAIPLKNYWKLYEEKPAKAIRQLTLDTHKKIKELIIHIPDENYDQINNIRKNNYHSHKGTLLEKFNTGKTIILNPEFGVLKKYKSKFPILALLLLPITLLGLIFHFPIRKLIDSMSDKKVKDSQFLATSKYLYGFFIFPIYYLVLGIGILVLLPYPFMFTLFLIPIGGRWIYRLLMN